MIEQLLNKWKKVPFKDHSETDLAQEKKTIRLPKYLINYIGELRENLHDGANFNDVVLLLLTHTYRTYNTPLVTKRALSQHHFYSMLDACDIPVINLNEVFYALNIPALSVQKFMDLDNHIPVLIQHNIDTFTRFFGVRRPFLEGDNVPPMTMRCDQGYRLWDEYEATVKCATSDALQTQHQLVVFCDPTSPRPRALCYLVARHQISLYVNFDVFHALFNAPLDDIIDTISNKKEGPLVTYYCVRDLSSLSKGEFVTPRLQSTPPGSQTSIGDISAHLSANGDRS